MDKAAPFEEPKDRHLPGSPSSSLALASPAEINFIRLDLARQKGCLRGKLLGDQLAQFMEIEDRSITIHTRQISRR